MTDRGPEIRRAGGGGCLRSLFLLWLLAYPALLVLPPLLGGTQGTGGLAVGILGSFAATGLFVPWLIGLVILGLAALVLHPGGTVVVVGRPEPSTRRSAPLAATKTCPRCAEAVMATAQVCRFCRHEFAPVVSLSASPPVGTPASHETPFTPLPSGRTGPQTEVATGPSARPPRRAFDGDLMQGRRRWRTVLGLLVLMLAVFLAGYVLTPLLGPMLYGKPSSFESSGPPATPLAVEAASSAPPSSPAAPAPTPTPASLGAPPSPPAMNPSTCTVTWLYTPPGWVTAIVEALVKGQDVPTGTLIDSFALSPCQKAIWLAGGAVDCHVQATACEGINDSPHGRYDRGLASP